MINYKNMLQNLEQPIHHYYLKKLNELDIKSFIIKLIRCFGLDIRRYKPDKSETAQLLSILSFHEVDLVFDVGANTGQFGKYLRDAGYDGAIVSFEPILAAWNELQKRSNKDPLWKTAPRGAIGSTDGEVDIHISGNSVSSSILGMLESHSHVAPGSSYVGVEKVPLKKLDSIAIDYLHQNAKVFLKIDTQGYEDRVLEGAAKLLPHVSVLQLELSLMPLYEDQRLFDEMVLILKNNGFVIWAISPAFTNPKSGRLLQIDATFCRS